jgi:hypothetical protein
VGQLEAKFERVNQRVENGDNKHLKVAGIGDKRRWSLNCPTDEEPINIYDTAEHRLVWEDEFPSDEHARTAMCVEQLLLARLAARPHHSQ